jgi:hypothetical protein
VIKIPFAFLPPGLLYMYSKYFYWLAQRLEPKFQFLTIHLEQTEARIKPIEYISMCLASLTVFFVFMIFVAYMATAFDVPFLIGLGSAALVTLFVFFQQMAYPRLVSSRRIRGIEINL